MTSPEKLCKQKENGGKYIKCWETEKYQPRILYLVKLSFRSKGELKSFTKKIKLEGICCQKTSLERNILINKFILVRG